MNKNVILIGSLQTRKQQQMALEIIEKKKYSVIADITSGLRFLNHKFMDHTRNFSKYDLSKAEKIGGRLVCVPFFKYKKNPKTKTVSRIISKTDWKEYDLFLGNSLPIREMDIFAVAGKNYPLVGSNRGASGIDGIISTACGFSLGINKGLILYLGDMTFLHDINGLSLLKDTKNHMIIVVLNNGGNGIFSELPIKNDKLFFEKFFFAPHSYSLSSACSVYNIKHVESSLNNFEKSYLKVINTKITTVIEIKTSI